MWILAVFIAFVVGQHFPGSRYVKNRIVGESFSFSDNLNTEIPQAPDSYFSAKGVWLNQNMNPKKQQDSIALFSPSISISGRDPQLIEVRTIVVDTSNGNINVFNSLRRLHDSGDDQRANHGSGTSGLSY